MGKHADRANSNIALFQMSTCGAASFHVERGTHGQLLNEGGLYASMWADYEQAVSWKIAGAQTEAAAVKGGEA